MYDAGERGLGCGKLFLEDSFRTNLPEIDQHAEEELKQKYIELLQSHGRTGMRRENQPVEDLQRPGVLSETTFEKMPETFIDAGLPEQLEEKKFHHGTGINRWQLNGTYALQSLNSDMPTAGAHSGGAVDILLALSCLSEDPLVGKPDKVLPMGLLISSFMNFGGYHSFVETLPIVQALARNEKFQVEVTKKNAQNLYNVFIDVAQNSAPEASKKIGEYKGAYDAATLVQDRLPRSSRESSKHPTLTYKDISHIIA